MIVWYFCAAFNNFPGITQPFLDNLPEQLFHLSSNPRVSRNANTIDWSAKEGKPLLQL